MTRIIITGAKGRMGQTLVACAKNFREVQIAAQIDMGDDLPAAIAQGDVVVDFSSHTATRGHRRGVRASTRKRWSSAPRGIRTPSGTTF